MAPRASRRETVANAKEKRIRDQAAFNMMTKLRRPEPLKGDDGRTVPRLFTVTNGGDGTMKLGVLPLAQYLNGHTFFVQVRPRPIPPDLPAPRARPPRISRTTSPSPSP